MRRGRGGGVLLVSEMSLLFWGFDFVWWLGVVGVCLFVRGEGDGRGRGSDGECR